MRVICCLWQTKICTSLILNKDMTYFRHLSLADNDSIHIRWSITWLTNWGRVTHICVSKVTMNGSGNGLLPGRRQAIIWTNAGILLIGHLGTNLSWNVNRNVYIFIQENAFESIVRILAAILSRLQCVKISRHFCCFQESSLPSVQLAEY